MQTKQIIYNYSVNRPVALDDRENPVEDLNNLPPLPVRYSGLIFHVKSLNEPYIFLNNLTTPIPLRSLATGNVLSVTTSNYRDLNNILNSVTTTAGSFLTVFPLNVTFIRHTNEWKYFSGKYNLASTTEYENLPSNLKSITARASLNGVEKVIDSSLNLTDLLLTTTSTQLESERYYLLNNVLYYSINNKLWKLGGSSLLLNNYNIVKGDNVINHNLNSTYLDIKLWININNMLTPIHSVNSKPVDVNKLTINSYLDLNDCTIIINTI